MVSKVVVFFVSIAIISLNCKAQQSGIVEYRIQFMGEKFDDHIRIIPGNRTYTFFDSAKIAYLAEKYVEMIFSTNDTLKSSYDSRPIDADYSVYSIISNGKQKEELTTENISVADTVINVGERPYMNRQGMTGYNYDSTYVWNVETGEDMEVLNLSYDFDLKKQLCGFCFSETWNYDKGNNSFLKKINEIIPYAFYYKNNYSEEEPELLFRRISVYRKQRSDNASELLYKDMTYDVRVINEVVLEEHWTYDYYFGLPEPDFCNRFVIDLLADVRSGKIKAYPIVPDTANGAGKINFGRQLSYKEVTDSLSYSTQTVIGADTAKLREVKKYTVAPVINTSITYKMNEYGDYEYDEYGNMIELSKEDVIVGYDTIWPSPGKYKHEVSKILTDTVVKYKMDETGEYIYNDYGEMIIEGTNISMDTIWNSTFLGLNEFEFYYTDTIFHNKPENIHSYRFYEDWYFDKESFAIRKKVNGIAFHTGVKRYNSNKKTYDFYSTCKVYFKLN